MGKELAGFLPQSQGAIGTGRDALETLWRLPELPFTEMFGRYSSDFPSAPQALMIDPETGHVQLKNFVSPAFLYSKESYAVRTLRTPKIMAELALFVKFTKESIERSGIDSGPLDFFEFGANNLLLAALLKPLASSYTAVDPVIGEEEINANPDIVAHTGLAEDFLNRQDTPFDIVVARHTLEHIESPVQLLRLLSKNLRGKGLIILEVPDFEALQRRQRFDAVFHQHYHYFDSHSLQNLAARVSMKLVGLQRNPAGSNGGSILVALQQGAEVVPPLNFEKRVSTIKKSIARFQISMDSMAAAIDEYPGPVRVFGAGHMLSTLDYHLEGRLRGLAEVIDDDPAKVGWHYKNLPLEIVAPPAKLEGFAVVVGALENVRSIVCRCVALSADLILAPSTL